MENKLETLRKRAEAALEKHQRDTNHEYPHDVQTLLHELQVYQAELEMQNEELRKVQNELIRSRDNYAYLYNQAPVGYVTLDENGEIVQANHTFAEMVAASQEISYGNQFTQFIITDDRSVFLSRYKAFFKKPENKIIDVRLLGRNKTAIDVQIRGNLLEPGLSDNADHQKLLLMSIHDVTKEKQACQLLEESERYYRTLIGNIHEDIMVINRDYVITDVNESYLHTLDIPSDEVIGSKCFMISHGYAAPCDLCGERCELMNVFETGEPAHIVHEHQKINGSTIWVDILFSPLKQNGRISSVVEAVRDITDIKTAEQDAIRSENKYRTLFKLSRDAIYLHGFSDEGIPSTFIDVNDVAINMLGYTKEEFLRMTPQDIDGKEYLESDSPEIVNNLLKSGEALFEAVHVTKDGLHVPVEISTNLIELDGLQLALSTVRDITQRKQAEAALLDSEAFQKSLLSAIPIPLFYKDHEGKYIGYNPAFEEFFGEKSKQLIGKTVFDITSPELAEVYYNYDTELFVNGGKQQYESQVINSLGEKREVIFYKSLFFDAQGNTKGLIGTILDITDRIKYEDRLRFHSMILNQIQDLVTVTDLEGMITYINESACNMLGMSQEELIGQHVSILGENPDMGATQEEIVNHTQQSNGWRGEVVNYNADGNTVILDCRTQVVKDSNGQPVALCGISTDITERKMNENAISLNYRIAKVFLQSSHDTIYKDVLDVVLSELHSQFGYFGYIDNDGNLACPSMTHNIWDKCHIPDKSVIFSRSSWGGIWGQSLLEQRSIIANKGLRLPEGHVQLENAMVVPIVDHGTLIGQFAVANKKGGYSTTDQFLLESAAAQTAPILKAMIEKSRHEVEQKKLEDQLLQAQKMESVGRLAGGVAHDFNNMLNVILGNTELVMHEMDPEQEMYEDLQEIYNAAERSVKLTRQLLAFARKQTIAPQVLDVNETMSGMLSMLQRLIGENIELNWMPGEDVWPVEMDPGQIDQILANLCVNARDAISSLGTITLETSNTVFDDSYCQNHSGFLPGEYVMIAITDSGHGMSKETINNIFDPFYTTKKTGKGTGLGLSTVYGIVKQNFGFINVYSEPDHGTTFKIYIPRYIGEEQRIDNTVSSIDTTRGHETILIAEDERENLKIISKMLKRQGYNVLIAKSPNEAITIAESHENEIDLLLTDVVMPEMNGLELSKRVLSLYPDIKCLFMSGYTANVIAHHGILDKGLYFLPKPFSINELTKKIREVIDENLY